MKQLKLLHSEDNNNKKRDFNLYSTNSTTMKKICMLTSDRLTATPKLGMCKRFLLQNSYFKCCIWETKHCFDSLVSKLKQNTPFFVPSTKQSLVVSNSILWMAFSGLF